MSTILGNGTITFGDGTVKSTVAVPWENITGAPTKLTDFANDLGNYGNWIATANISTTPVTPPPLVLHDDDGEIVAGPVQINMTWDGTGTILSLTSPNCNCYCNC
jgi:hypothetical protein